MGNDARWTDRLGRILQIVETPQLGMHGNSHMLMQDRNNLQIADVVTSWIAQRVR